MRVRLRGSRDLLTLVLVAAAAYIVGRDSAPTPLQADTVDHNRDMIAVTGEFGMGTSVLYLVDTRARSLAVYEARGGSQSNLKFLAARDIAYDLKVRSYNDLTEAGMKVEELERRWRQFAGRQGAGAGLPAPGQALPPGRQAPGPGGEPLPDRPEDGGSKKEGPKIE
ncbi:MAG: hypothetical protein JXQ29_04520 [Planctomycetes bacterium]|nr:hypothetical protein [Planctomycetota bacterium]